MERGSRCKISAIRGEGSKQYIAACGSAADPHAAGCLSQQSQAEKTGVANNKYHAI